MSASDLSTSPLATSPSSSTSPALITPAQDGASHRAKTEAADWFALLRSGEATDRDRAAWQTWLAASEGHRAAWTFVERVSRRFEPIQASPDPRSTIAVLEKSQTKSAANRRQVLRSIAVFGGTSLLGWAAWRHTPLVTLATAWTADYRSGIGEVKEIALADGTRVWLGSASAFNADYRAMLRRLDLVSGEILIDTASDPVRPFVVETPHGRLRALGTRFNVRLDDEHTFLAVYEGAVEVRAASGAITVIRAGEQTRLDGNTIDSAVSAAPGSDAWPRGLLIAQDMPLAQVAAELARYRHGHIAVAPEIAGLRVYGSFPLQEPDRALQMLTAILPIQVRQPLPWWSSLEPKQKKN